MALFLLMLAPFAFGTGAYVFTGLLEPMAGDLGTSVAAVAQLQTAFALACAIGGPVLARVTGRINRKGLLVATLLWLAGANLLAALAEALPLLLVARIAGGFVGALTLPLASTLAVMLVSPERRPAALAAVFAGTALSFLVGVPLGSVVGGAFGWPASFAMAAVVCVIVALLIAVGVPRQDAAPPPALGGFAQVLRWPTTGFLALTWLSFAATFCTVALIGPIITRLTGFTGGAIGAMQFLVGIGSILGLVFGARLARFPPALVIRGLFTVIILSQMLYAVGLSTGVSGVSGVVLAACAIMPGAAALFALSPVIQSRLAEAAGPAATLAFALNGSMIFLGQGTGAAIGGAVTGLLDLTYVSLAGIVVALGGLWLGARVSQAPAPVSP